MPLKFSPQRNCCRYPPWCKPSSLLRQITARSPSRNTPAPGGAVTIPNTTNGYPVTSIGSYAFFEYYGLTGVTIPDSVTSIGDSAFFYCTNLTSVTIASSVTSIGDDAFAYCTSLTSVKIPDSITSIGDGAFADCSGLTSVTIGSGVTSIWDHAFYVCSSLTRVYFQGNSPTPTNDTSVFSYDPATVYY